MRPKPWKSILLLATVVLAWFSPWWIAGKNLAPLDLQSQMMSPWRPGDETEFAKNHIVSDAVDQYLVYRKVAAESYAKEGRVGWSSLTYGGTAQYANTMALYFDWTMQLHRFFDFWTAWHLGLMGQFMLAATGMLLFLRGRSIGALWATCGALAFAANSQFITWIYHRWSLGAFCWVPWILWAIDSHRRGQRGFAVAIPVFIGMAFLGGTLQHAALVVLAVMAMWMEDAFKTARDWRPQTRLIARYTAWGLLGSGLAGMMLLPCIDAFLTSHKLGLHTGMTANAGNSIYPQGPMQALYNLAAYPFQIFPSILGRCGSVDVLKLFKSELFYVVYFGSLPVLIAYLSFWRKDSPLLGRLLIGMGLLLPLTPLVRLLYQRLFLLFVIGGILAFAHFMTSATRELKLRVFRIVATIVGLGVLVWTGLSVVFVFQPQLATKIRDQIAAQGAGSSFGYFSDWMILRADRFVGDLLIWSPQQLYPLLLLAAALVGLRWTAARNSHWRKRGALLVTMAVVGEVTLFGSRWVVWSDPAQHPLFPETAESRALEEFVGREGRVTTLIHPTAHMAVTPFIPNILSAYGIPIIGGYDSIVPDGMILPNETPGDAGKLGRLGVSHLVTWHGNEEVPKEWKRVWRSEKMDLYQNPLAVARYAGFESTGDRDEFFEGRSNESQKLTERSGMENRREIEVPAGIAWIRVAENQAEGWKYRLAGTSETWRAVTRAADASMLIKHPQPDQAGVIEMRYDPPLRKLGWWLSGLSLVLVGGIGIFFMGDPALAAKGTRGKSE